MKKFKYFDYVFLTVSQFFLKLYMQSGNLPDTPCIYEEKHPVKLKAFFIVDRTIMQLWHVPALYMCHF